MKHETSLAVFLTCIGLTLLALTFILTAGGDRPAVTTATRPALAIFVTKYGRTRRPATNPGGVHTS
jgi:hypothetical protein